MDIKQLINFITIVEEGNITKAAQKLHISQPPLSNQLKALEEELGVKLIERGSRKVTLTDVGNLLYKRGKDMVNVFESTLNEVEDFKSGIEGVLKIGAVSTCNQFIPNELISPYAKQYPKVKFELYEGNTYEVVDMIERGIVDIETLQKTNESLISTFDEVMNIQREGREKRRAAEAEMYRLEGELKQKLLQINH